MIFNAHSALIGKHALLSASNHHWVNYDDQKLAARYVSFRAARRGTDLHDLAHKAIALGVPLGEGAGIALELYVQDGIGYRMSCEQPLFYSPNCFGTPDTIAFRENLLRVHDLKTGIAKTSSRQLEVYAAIFCLEYSIDPSTIDFELRIYQGDDVNTFEPSADIIDTIMERIVIFDQKIEEMKASDLY